ncbi:MAG TPA: aldo/keto reductase [Microlunatus sp.]
MPPHDDSGMHQGVLTGRFHDDPDSFRRVPRLRRTMMGGNRVPRRTEPLIKGLMAIAVAHGVRPGQVALAWVISNYRDTVVCIPGASKPSHATESAAVMDLKLSENELAALNERS